MNLYSEKRRFVKSFCALSVAALMLCSSLVSGAAAIAGASAEDKSDNAQQAAVFENVPTAKKVVLDINSVQKTVLFSGKTVEELLRVNRVTLGDNQIVVPSAYAKVTPYMVVSVRDAKEVSVTADGKTKNVMLALGNVTDALRLAGVSLGSDDILSVSRDEQVENIENLTIQRVTYRQKKETETIAYKKLTENSDEVELGETKVSVKGVNGEKKVVKSVQYIDGKQTKETVVSETITKRAVNEVTLIGTKGAGTIGGVGTFTDSNGVTVSYKEVLTGSGTAYTASAGAYTATGVPAYRGGVAVNPDIIPYGSKLYVVSTDGSVVYGYCTAVDTGGALMDGSAIVDCFYDTYDECINFGRRDVNVYVLS